MIKHKYKLNNKKKEKHHLALRIKSAMTMFVTWTVAVSVQWGASHAPFARSCTNHLRIYNVIFCSAVYAKMVMDCATLWFKKTSGVWTTELLVRASQAL
jgi:hypothetical protein